MQIIQAKTTEEVAEARILFQEYAGELGLDLGFQGFAKELAQLPRGYIPPEGNLLLAVEDTKVNGCCGFKRLEVEICEMKRLYVRPGKRGTGLGRMLSVETIRNAVICGYKSMRLDTFEWMKDALGIYRKIGFKNIPPYYHNPHPDVVYLELDLTHWKGDPC